jgi:phosphatidylglycerophosphate synthase
MPTDLPNLLTLSRIAAIPLLVVLASINTPQADMAACVVFSIAARFPALAACWTRLRISFWSARR